uniref:Uncharacterized protein n=1 Tax=Myotis myotis TaxID=51298 RepID=A0A7J7XID7_MYOMY|nr:hypothetical protein mMyoMyo1_011647 [Myotis myotis]
MILFQLPLEPSKMKKEWHLFLRLKTREVIFCQSYHNAWGCGEGREEITPAAFYMGLGILESVKSPVEKARSNLLSMTGLPKGSAMGNKGRGQNQFNVCLRIFIGSGSCPGEVNGGKRRLM